MEHVKKKTMFFVELYLNVLLVHNYIEIRICTIKICVNLTEELMIFSKLNDEKI